MGKACVAIFWPTPGTDAENSAVQCAQASFRDEALNKFSIERLTRDQKVSGSITGRSGGRMFFFAVSTFCTKSVKVFRVFKLNTTRKKKTWTLYRKRRPEHYTKEELEKKKTWTLYERRRPGHYTKEEDLDTIRRRRPGHYTEKEDLDTIRKKKTWTLYDRRRRRPGRYTKEEDLNTIRKKKKTWTLYERRAGHYTKEEEDLDTVRKKKKKTWTLYERRRRPGHYTKEDLDTIRKKKKKTWTLYERRRRRPVEWWQTLLVSTSGRTGRWSARTFHP